MPKHSLRRIVTSGLTIWLLISMSIVGIATTGLTLVPSERSVQAAESDGNHRIYLPIVNTPFPDALGQGVVVVDSQTGGLVTTDSGASLEIPPGAVPLRDDGQVGEMTFNMQVVDRTPSLPSEFTPVGLVYQLGPEGFTFNTPVILNLPIPNDVDPASVLGFTYYDATSGEWQMVPATVDAENRIATVATTHFSPWGLFRFSRSDTTWRNTNGGRIRVRNPHRYESGVYPPPDGNLPYTVTYGVCVRSYTLADPQQSWAWTPPQNWTMTVNAYVHPLSWNYGQPRQADWWLPNGTYDLIEVWHFSEVNRSTGYVPRFASYWRPIGNTTVNAQNPQEFVYSEANLDLANFTAGRPPCFGRQDTSAGTGDVQITLNWNARVDLDLHVIDPNGERIYYANTRSRSGGQLDRDNLCWNMILGRPENIFWPSGEAPPGTYIIQVDYFSGCGGSEAVPFSVRAVIQGQVYTFTGVSRPGDRRVEVGRVEVR
ncbi:hypothetical protein [Candidatus Viridilinea mediisalina]|uniref:ZU5 domain-containing protein n=1 Tax=Candidatus Viridilinea mediisalina TaxID=2024553 RepID=A0A2A6RPX5_9CHLR|nr:hypothetical protein [Candidatus Viridilinea mediisalina]PDW04929.1 hypothetical protein CJ255_00695 [Candidatus Viridilinea mediisalina]